MQLVRREILLTCGGMFFTLEMAYEWKMDLGTMTEAKVWKRLLEHSLCVTKRDIVLGVWPSWAPGKQINWL